MKSICSIIFKIICIVLCLSAIACSNKETIDNSELTGKEGELLIVINDEYKNSEISVSISDIMNQYEIGITQSESPFNILMISKNHFSSVFRPHRNILHIEINSKFEKPKIEFRKNIWVQGQACINISVKDQGTLESFLKENHSHIIDYFTKAEIDRNIEKYKKTAQTQIQNIIQKEFNLSINVPQGFQINKQTKNFLWFSLETKELSQGIILYQRPYTDTNQLNKWPLLNYRDSIVKTHIPGPTKGSYMTTEYITPTQYKIGRYIQNNYTVEIRGKWRVEYDFMTGPFVSYSFVDAHKKTITTIEGYVYYPNKNKRNYMRQLQAICQSITYPSIE